ncbi:MAG: hypothetical protein ABIH20_05700 [Candidatus Diapherotrites archaeon]
MPGLFKPRRLSIKLAADKGTGESSRSAAGGKKKSAKPLSNSARMKKIAEEALEFTRDARVTETKNNQHIGFQGIGTLYYVKSGRITREFGVYGRPPNINVAVKVRNKFRVIVDKSIAREIRTFLEKRR